MSHSDDVGCRRLIGQLQVYSLLVLVIVAGSGCCCASGRGADLGRFQGILSLGPRRVRRPAHNSGGRRCRSFGDDGALLGRGVLNNVELLRQGRSRKGKQQTCSDQVSTHRILLVGPATTPKLDSRFHPEVIMTGG